MSLLKNAKTWTASTRYYSEHPSTKTYPEDLEGNFWWKLSNNQWSSTKHKWYSNIDDPGPRYSWNKENRWYTAKELEGWCETYKTYAETHDDKDLEHAARKIQRQTITPELDPTLPDF